MVRLAGSFLTTFKIGCAFKRAILACAIPECDIEIVDVRPVSR